MGRRGGSGGFGRRPMGGIGSRGSMGLGNRRSAGNASVPTRTAAPPRAPAPVSAGQPSAMRDIATTAAGVAAGNVVGHGISRALFAGGDSMHPQMVQGEVNGSQSFNNNQMEYCKMLFEDVQKCLSSNSSANQCSSLFDAFGSRCFGYSNGGSLSSSSQVENRQDSFE